MKIIERLKRWNRNRKRQILLDELSTKRARMKVLLLMRLRGEISKKLEQEDKDLRIDIQVLNVRLNELERSR